jgi:hypothetical protein
MMNFIFPVETNENKKIFRSKNYLTTIPQVMLRVLSFHLIIVVLLLQVEVPFEFHRFVIGQKGAGVRQLMNDFDVNIKVPQSEMKSNIVIVTGPPPNVEEARKALLERLVELEGEKADRELKSFEIKMDIKPEYHPKIIGKRGAVITKLRDDYDVNIQLPRKESPEDSIITITGYEKNALAAKEAIQKIVGDFVSLLLCSSKYSNCSKT